MIRNCNGILIGDRASGHKDPNSKYLRSYNRRFVNLRKVDLNGKVTSEITNYYVTLPASWNHKNHETYNKN